MAQTMTLGRFELFLAMRMGSVPHSTTTLPPPKKSIKKTAKKRSRAPISLVEYSRGRKLSVVGKTETSNDPARIRVEELAVEPDTGFATLSDTDHDAKLLPPCSLLVALTIAPAPAAVVTPALLAGSFSSITSATRIAWELHSPGQEPTVAYLLPTPVVVCRPSSESWFALSCVHDVLRCSTDTRISINALGSTLRKRHGHLFGKASRFGALLPFLRKHHPHYVILEQHIATDNKRHAKPTLTWVVSWRTPEMAPPFSFSLPPTPPRDTESAKMAAMKIAVANMAATTGHGNSETTLPQLALIAIQNVLLEAKKPMLICVLGDAIRKRHGPLFARKKDSLSVRSASSLGTLQFFIKAHASHFQWHENTKPPSSSILIGWREQPLQLR